MQYTQLEMARIFGQPVDPSKPYTELEQRTCDLDVADPNEYHYYYDVLVETNKVYTLTSGGVSQENVAPDTPAALTFVSVVSPEYYMKLTDLTSAKERTVSRKLKTIERALNAFENYKIIDAMRASCDANTRANQLTGSEAAFNYAHLVTMIDNCIDYGDSYTLIAGTTIDKDIKLWDWTDNKYTSLAAAFKDLATDVIRLNQSVTIDGSSVSVLGSTRAFLVAKDTEMGKPLLFVRKLLNDIEWLGGSIMRDGSNPQRLVFISPNPITVTSTARFLAVGCTGFEEIAGVVKNLYGLYKFDRY